MASREVAHDDDREAFFRAAGITPPPRGEDLPYDDGEPMETEQHKKQMDLLMDSLIRGWRTERPFYVGGNMALYFSAIQARNQDFRAPDLFVVLDVDDSHMRKSWVVWEEEGRTPDVVVELLSESTEKADRGIKKDVYRLLKVGAYYVFDPLTLAFEGWSYDPVTREYVPLERDERGHLACPPLGLWLGIVEGEFQRRRRPWLRWLDENRAPLMTGEEQAEAAATRANAEAERASAAAERANAEAERANAETERANAEAVRAKAEAERANAEAERGKAIAAKLAEYERRFGSLADQDPPAEG